MMVLEPIEEGERSQREVKRRKGLGSKPESLLKVGQTEKTPSKETENKWPEKQDADQECVVSQKETERAQEGAFRGTRNVEASGMAPSVPADELGGWCHIRGHGNHPATPCHLAIPELYPLQSTGKPGTGLDASTQSGRSSVSSRSQSSTAASKSATSHTPDMFLGLTGEDGQMWKKTAFLQRWPSPSSG